MWSKQQTMKRSDRTTDIWHNGIHLTPDQHTVIYASPFGHQYRCMYNRVEKKFIPVHEVIYNKWKFNNNVLNDAEYLCFKADMDEAKAVAKAQDLDVNSVEYAKIG